MSLILSGSDGVSDIDGTVSTPAIRGTDSNTGIFFPAADTIAFAEGGVESMRIDSSGNLGIGTTSPVNKLQIGAASDTAVALSNSSSVTSGNRGTISMFNSGTSTVGYIRFGAVTDNVGTDIQFGIRPVGGSITEAMRIDSSGNVGIGTSSPSGKLQIDLGNLSTVGAKTNSGLNITGTSGANGNIYQIGFGYATGASNVPAAIYALTTSNAGFNNNAICFATRDVTTDTAPTERMRITSAGVLCFGRTTPIDDAVLAGAANFQSIQTAFEAYRTSTSVNSIIQAFSDEGSTKSLRFQVRCNGGVANYSANDANLSDAREKTDIELAGSYLDKICAIPVKTFNYINQSDDGLTLGVIAQDVQAVAPELVMESDWGTKDEPKNRLSIYQTDLQYALMKCIQEQQALIENLTTRLNALEGK